MSACILVIAQEVDSILESAIKEVMDLSPLKASWIQPQENPSYSFPYMSVSMHSSSKFNKYSHLKQLNASGNH